MSKATKSKKPKLPPAPVTGRTFSSEAQEIRALLRRIPDGQRATLTALAAKPLAERERVMAELVRGLGKEILPLFKAAALGINDELARSAIRLLPVFGTRAAADILTEVHSANPVGERAVLARETANAFRARGVQVPIPEPDIVEAPAKYTLRETWVGAPERVGSRTVVARLQDEYGVWHAIIVLWNDQAGVKEGFMRPLSRHEWDERALRMEERGTPQVQCPVDYVRWEVAHARAINERSGLPLENFLEEWDRQVGPPPPGYVPPDPVAPVIAANEETRIAWLNSGSLLATTTDISKWFLEAADCVEWARKWNEVQSRARFRSGQGQNPHGTPEAKALLSEAADHLFTTELRELYRTRLVDLARVLEWRRQEDLSRQAAAAAFALQEGVPASEIPVLAAIVETSLRTTELLMARGEDLERLRYRPMRRRQF